MTYEEALQYIASTERFGSKLGLDRIRLLLERLGNPQDDLRYVHVAGTNGKGSITTMIASVLTRAGYHTGSYTSPYIVDFRERMQLDGQMIPQQELSAVVSKVREQVERLAAEGVQLTEFEIITAAAFVWYRQKQADIVVLEVGLGGRFDATNVISARNSVIAAIDYDHVEVLGDTIEKIAFEKCGIIKAGCPVVAYPLQQEGALRVIREQCAHRGSLLTMPDPDAVRDIEVDLAGNRFTYRGMPLHTGLIGIHQVYNAITAVEALVCLSSKGWKIPAEAMKEGLAQARIPARMEVLSQHPLVILDGAHNLSGVSTLREALTQMGLHNITAITGMLRDKDHLHALEQIAPYLKRMVVTSPQSPRALPAEELAREAERFCGDVVVAEGYEDAIGEAFARPGDAVLVFGSLYLAAPMRGLLLKKLGPPR